MSKSHNGKPLFHLIWVVVTWAIFQYSDASHNRLEALELRYMARRVQFLAHTFIPQIVESPLFS